MKGRREGRKEERKEGRKEGDEDDMKRLQVRKGREGKEREGMGRWSLYT